MNAWEAWLKNWVNQISLKDSSYLLVISSDFSGMALMAASMKCKADPLSLIKFMEARWPGITILIPAFKNHYQPGEWFDPQNTIPETGSLARKAYKDPSFLRTLDPLHSFLVKGPLSESCMQAIDESTFGKNSVFGWLHQHKAFQLFIDVDLQHSFTFAHYVEEQLQVPYRKYKNLMIPVKCPDERMIEKKVKFYAKKPGYMIQLNGLENLLIKGGVMIRGEMDGISWMLIDLSKSYDIIADEVQKNQARNLIIFDINQFLRDVAKKWLKKI